MEIYKRAHPKRKGTPHHIQDHSPSSINAGLHHPHPHHLQLSYSSNHHPSTNYLTTPPRHYPTHLNLSISSLYRLSSPLTSHLSKYLLPTSQRILRGDELSDRRSREANERLIERLGPRPTVDHRLGTNTLGSNPTGRVDPPPPTPKSGPTREEDNSPHSADSDYTIIP